MRKTQTVTRFFVLLTVGIVALLAVACAGPTPAPIPAPQPTSAPTVALAAPTVAPTVAPTTAPPPAAPTAPPAPTAAPQPTAASAQGFQVLRIGEDIYPDVIDPQRSSFANEIEALKLAYEGLLTVNPDGSLGEGAAQKVSFSPDGMSATFQLRDGLKRADGTALTAKDFEYALKRAVDPRVPGKQYSQLMYQVKGAQDAAKLDPKTASKDDITKALANVGVQAKDDKTLVVTFNQPTGRWWAYIAAQPITFPTDARAADKDPENWWKTAKNHAGNGPFVIDSISDGKKIAFAPNPNYWRGKPTLSRVEISYNPDQKALYDAYKKGDIDIDAAVTADVAGQAKADTTLAKELQMYPGMQTVALAFNNTRKPFDDINVRVAFSQALDRAGFVKDMLGGIGAPYTRWIPKGVLGAQSAIPGVPDTDFAAAVNTLVNHGYAAADSTKDKPKVDCNKLGAIKFTYPDSPTNTQYAQYIAKNLSTVIGCQIGLDPVQGTEFTSMTKDVTTNPQLSLQRWIGDYPHPQNWLSTYWSCGAFSRRYGYCNLFMDQLLQAADKQGNLEASVALYKQAEDMLVHDVPAAFFFNPENLQLVKPYVQGPTDNLGPRDGWAGDSGPVYEYGIDLSQVPTSYPKE